MSIEGKELVELRSAEYARAAHAAHELATPPAAMTRAEFRREEEQGRVGVCLCCGSVAVIGHAMHVCQECFASGDHLTPALSPSGEGEENGGAK